MGLLKDLRDSELIEKRICQICGEPGYAFWHGIDTIVVCNKCGRETLPSLIADSVLGHQTNDFRQSAERALKEIENHFLRAALSRADVRINRLEHEQKSQGPVGGRNEATDD